MTIALDLAWRLAVIVATKPLAQLVFLIVGGIGLVIRHENGVDAPRSWAGLCFGALAVGCSYPLRLGFHGAQRLVEGQLAGGGLRRRWRQAAQANKEDPGDVKETHSIIVEGERVGHRLFVKLPAGTIASDYNPERVASAYRAVRVSVEADPHDARIAHVSVYTREPLAATLNPEPSVETLEPAGIVRIGLSYDGDPLVIDTRLAHVKTGGQTRYGKSNFLHLLIADYCRRADTTLVILDGKSIDFPDWEDRCALYLANEADTPGQHVARARHALRSCLAEMEARYSAMKAAGYKNTSSMPPDHEHRPGALLVVVDEIPRYLDDNEHGAAIEAMLIRLVKEGLAANVHVAVSTQKATADAIPTAISSVCEIGVAFHCETLPMGQAILGNAKLGADAVALPRGDAHRGRCIVATADGEHTHGRCYYASDAWIRQAAACTARVDLAPHLEETRRLSPDRGTEPRAHAHATMPAEPASPRRRRRRGPKPGSETAQRVAERAREAKAQRRLELAPPPPPSPPEDS